jgi:hypothetical protein
MWSAKVLGLGMVARKGKGLERDVMWMGLGLQEIEGVYV